MMWPKRNRDERGATAIMVTFLAIALFAAAAMAVDYTSLVMEKQRLHDHIDSAAHAGAFELPGNGANAANVAVNMAKAQDSTLTPDVDLFCVVASTGSTRQVLARQIPATCNPGDAPYSESRYPGLRCNTTICAIPCRASAGTTCNTVRVTENKMVDFGFGPVIGIPTGDTGAVASAACKGSCGSELPNPLDVVIVADRTPSMTNADRELMKTAILDTLKTMDPQMHYVSFGTIHKSRTDNPSCITDDTTSGMGASGGTWLPVGFRNDYLTSASVPTLNAASPLVAGVSCLPASSDGGFGTHLASPLKFAARALLSGATNSMPARPGTAKKIIILETDGRPEETINTAYSSLNTTGEIGTNYKNTGSGQAGCNNFIDMANEVKNRGIIIMTIGFGGATDNRCNRPSSGSGIGDGTLVREVLAKGASPHPITGQPSQAGNCGTAAGRTAENTDGDFFFCAATGPELAPLFATAISQVTNSIRLIKLPS